MSKFTPFQTKVFSRHIEGLKEAKVFLSLKGFYEKSWLSKTRLIIFRKPIFVEPYSCFINGGFFTMGAHSYSKSAFKYGVKIGRYCSISSGVTIMPTDHPLNRLSTCGIDYAQTAIHPQCFQKKDFKQKPLILEIGNDVWIGEGAILGRNIKIGHGAVIATKAIVTKDVPPYAIVAGSPAVVKKYRFDENTRKRLLETEWWNVKPESIAHLDTTDIHAFLDGFEDLKEKGLLEPYILPQIALHEIFKPKPPSINANKKKKTAIKKLMFHFSSLFGKSKQSVKA
jgi:acetyltransferase-like isoleucine patch superfamily enzyme